MSDRKFGSLWKNTSKTGMEFLGGEMIVNGKKIKIVAFERGEKKNDKEPDWDLLLAKEDNGITV
jgi:hypothetical protein